MSINDITPQALANHRYKVNPDSPKLASSHGAARKSNDDRKCDLEIKALESLDVDSADYFDGLLAEDLH